MKPLILLITVVLISCATCPKATPENVRKWERRHRFTAGMDSCERVRYYQKGLAMARKY